MAHGISIVPIAALFCAASALAQPAVPPARVTEELICERPEKDAGRMFRALDHVSGDLGKVAWILKRDVVVNGEPLGPPADEFLEPVLSPDGRHVLRAGRQKKSWFVWLDAQQVAGPFDGVRRPHFAPDGRVVFAAKREQAWTWLVDGKELPVATPARRSDAALCRSDSVLWNIDRPTTRDALDRCWSALISFAKDRVAYTTRRDDGWHVVADGQVGPPFDAILQTTFSPDGSRLAYLGVRRGRVVAVVDGREEPARDAVEGLQFSADSRRVAYLAVDASKERVTGTVVADGAPGRSWPALLLNARDDLRANAGLTDQGLWVSPVLAPYMTGASVPQFRSDGKLVYAVHSESGLEGIWVEGADKPLVQSKGVFAGPVPSEGGEHVAWVGLDEKASAWTGFVDGQPKGSVPVVPKKPNRAEHLTVSRDGSRLAFVHVAGGITVNQLDVRAPRRVVATGLEDKTYDADDLLNLRFSDDGKHLAYEVHGARGLGVKGRDFAGVVVLDGVPGRAYSEVLQGTMRFVGPDVVRYVARVQEAKNGPYRYYRVTQRAP